MWIPLQCQRKDRRRLNHAAGPLIGDERYLASQNGASPQYAVRRSASAAPKMAAYLKCVRLNAHDWQRINQSAQGNRANRLCCDEAGEVVVVPCGNLSPEAEGVLAVGCARQVQRHMLDGGEVGWGVVGSDAAFIVAEDHIHDPVQAVLDGPMASHDHGQAFGRQAQRSDEEPRLPFDRATDLADAVDDDDAVQAGPVVALLQPGDVVDDGGGPGLDAAVIAVDGFVPAAGGVLKPLLFCSATKSSTSSRNAPWLPFRART